MPRGPNQLVRKLSRGAESEGGMRHFPCSNNRLCWLVVFAHPWRVAAGRSGRNCVVREFLSPRGGVWPGISNPPVSPPSGWMLPAIRAKLKLLKIVTKQNKPVERFLQPSVEDSGCRTGSVLRAACRQPALTRKMSRGCALSRGWRKRGHPFCLRGSLNLSMNIKSGLTISAVRDRHRRASGYAARGRRSAKRETAAALRASRRMKGMPLHGDLRCAQHTSRCPIGRWRFPAPDPAR